MIDSKTSRLFRGIAILMVIGSHYAAAMYVEPVRLFAKEFVSTLGIYGVDIFFMLSGYGLVKSALKNGVNKEFVLRRFLNTYVPYLLVIGFFSIVDKSITNIQDLFKFLAGLDYWYMNVIFIIYILFMIVYKIDKFRVILITIAIIGFCVFLYNYGRADFWFISNGAFLVGIYGAELENKFGLKVQEWIKKINLFTISVALTVIGWFIYTSSGELWAHVFTSVCFSIVMFSLCVQFEGGGIILPSIGRYSLYIYLLHLRLFWKIVMIKPEMNYALNAAIAGVVTIVVCIALGFAIEWNLNRLFKKK